MIKNKTVLITRSREQSNHFSEQLKALGFNTITLPLIEITPINSDKLTKVVTKNQYDWILFTSTNAVKYFFNAVPKNKISSKIAVVGNKTQEAIQELGLDIQFIPTKYTGKNLAEELPIYSKNKILIPHSAKASNEIEKILQKRGCNITIIDIYENKAIQYKKEKLAEIITQNIDYVVFTSASIVEAFYKLPYKINAKKIICIGPETAKRAKALNLKVNAVSNPHNTEGMISAILNLEH